MAKIIEHKCPNCGGSIEFDTSAQLMKCPFCDSEFDVAAFCDEDAGRVEEERMEWDEGVYENIADGAHGLKSYICTSCGGEIVCDETTAASSCPFCGNQVVMSENVSGMLRPDMVLPFRLDKKAAKEALYNFYKGKKLLPDFFADENRIDEVKGVYVPFWLYSCRANVDMRFHGTKVRSWSDKKYHYTETSHYRIIRSGFLDFAGVPVDGSTKAPDDIMESLEPFDYSEGVDFEAAYLSGFFADKYDVDSGECQERANTRIKSSATAAISATAPGYSSLVPEAGSVRFNHGNVRYAMLPVWMLTTTYKGQKYTFAMNGQTGKFVGDLPVDNGKYWKYFGITAASFFAVAAALLLLL